MAVYTCNQTVRITGRFYDSTSAPADPPGVKLMVRRPDGSILEFFLTDADTPIMRDSEGVYAAIIRATIPGRWLYQFESTAPDGVGSQPAEGSYFDVSPSAFAA